MTKLYICLASEVHMEWKTDVQTEWTSTQVKKEPTQSLHDIRILNYGWDLNFKNSLVH